MINNNIVSVAALGSPVQGELAFAKQMTEGLSVAAYKLTEPSS
jgi:hypothetical protein